MVVEIPSLPPLVVDFPEVGIDCINSELTLRPEIRSSFGTVDFLWNDNSALESLTTATSGEYSIIISDECQSVEYNWNLEFSLDIDEEMIYLPNIFSPNNDGINDCFTPSIHGRINLITYHQIIFDRWGNKMFESNDISDCWNGIYKNKSVRLGVYVYITDILADQCAEAKNLRRVGDVIVIR